MINKISDIRNGHSFKHYLEKFSIPHTPQMIPTKTLEKMFVDHKILSKIIELFISFCPELQPAITRGANSSKKTELIKETLSSIQWSKLSSEIYDIMESEGDAFFYIYFDENKNKKTGKNKKIIPRLKLLNSKNMEHIILDDVNQPKAYIYKHKIYDTEIDYNTGQVHKRNEREETLIFEKGQCHSIVNGISSSGTLVLDSENNIKMEKNTIKNDDILKDSISIIHICSDKKQNEKFSVIPAEEYVDLCLWIDQINSDIRTIDRNLGYPQHILLDCTFVEGDGQIGGVRVAKTIKDPDEIDSSRQGKVIDLQITNGLDTMFKEYELAIDNLYDKVGITNPTLMKRVSSSDSSKMYNQVNMRMEQKIEKYIDNIIEGFKPFFRILFTINGLYKEQYDYGYSFAKPKSIIKNSAYDDLLIKQLELNTGYKTLYDLLKEKGYTEQDIDNHFNNINKELRNGKQDLKRVKEGEYDKGIVE